MARARGVSWPTIVVAVIASLGASYLAQHLDRSVEASAGPALPAPSPPAPSSSVRRGASHEATDSPAGPPGTRSERAAEVEEPGTPTPPMPSYEQMFAEDQRLNAARVSAVNETFAAQVRDPDWARQTEFVLERAASELLTENGRLIRLECRSTLCSVRAEHQDEESQAQFISTLPMRVFRDLDGAFLARFAGEGGALETHGFFAKQGHSVPLPEFQ